MFLIRLALAFSFVYAGIGSLQNPDNWIGFVPGFVGEIISVPLFLTIFSVVQIILGLWLLSGKLKIISGLIAAAMLFGITLFNFTSMDIVFRDISLGLVAIAFAFSSNKRHDQR
jgi:uncharacterized membrane protein YphA (DoxX/SURF4 family)